jgi:transglutaminase-like putative cysteine protease
VIAEPPSEEARYLLAAAEVAGARVQGAERAPFAGETVTHLQIECDSNEHAVRLLAAMADAYALHPDVQHLASELCARAQGPADKARTLHAYVRQHVAFQPEEEETFRSPLVTLRLGLGDCDDQAVCVAALAQAAGLDAHIASLRDAEGEIAHVATQIRVGGAWLWAETTIAAELGEHPHAAALRLELQDRPDLRA